MEVVCLTCFVVEKLLQNLSARQEFTVHVLCGFARLPVTVGTRVTILTSTSFSRLSK